MVFEQGVGCCIRVAIWLPVRRCGETMHWQPSENMPLSANPLFNQPENSLKTGSTQRKENGRSLILLNGHSVKKGPIRIKKGIPSSKGMASIPPKQQELEVQTLAQRSQMATLWGNPALLGFWGVVNSLFSENHP